MITRRTALSLMRSSLAIGAIGVVAAVSQCQPVPAASHAPSDVGDELALLIRAHRAAYAALAAHGDELTRAQAAFYGDRGNVEALRAKEAAQRRERELAAFEHRALVAMLSWPCRDLHELRAVVRIAKEFWWTHDRPEEDEFDALLAGILGGGA